MLALLTMLTAERVQLGQHIKSGLHDNHSLSTRTTRMRMIKWLALHTHLKSLGHSHDEAVFITDIATYQRGTHNV